MAKNPNVAKEAEQYLSRMQVKFQSYKRDWEKFPDEMLEKSKEILLSNLTPEVSRDYGAGGYSYNVNINLDQNRSALEEYLSTVKNQLQSKADKFHAAIKEMNDKLVYFKKNGLTEPEMQELVHHLGQWLDYAKVLTFRYNDSKYEIAMPEQLLTKGQRWLDEIPVSGKQKSAAKPEHKTVAEEETPVVGLDQKVLDKRQEEVKRIKRTLKKEYEQEIQKIQKQYDADRKKTNDEINSIARELLEKRNHLNTLGFFQFKEKSAAKSEIAALEQEKVQIEQIFRTLEENFDCQESALRSKVEKSWNRQRKEIQKRFPAPGTASLPNLILLGMDPGSKYTLQEMAEFPGVPVEITPYMLNSRIVSMLVSQGKLQRVEENGIRYFMLP